MVFYFFDKAKSEDWITDLYPKQGYERFFVYGQWFLIIENNQFLDMNISFPVSAPNKKN